MSDEILMFIVLVKRLSRQANIKLPHVTQEDIFINRAIVLIFGGSKYALSVN